MTTNPNTPHPILDEEAIWAHVHAALDARTRLAIWTAIGDIPVLLAEVRRLGQLLTETRMEYANLLAAARATLSAQDDGENDPLFYLRDEITASHPPVDRQ